MWETHSITTQVQKYECDHSCRVDNENANSDGPPSQAPWAEVSARGWEGSSGDSNSTSKNPGAGSQQEGPVSGGHRAREVLGQTCQTRQGRKRALTLLQDEEETIKKL